MRNRGLQKWIWVLIYGGMLGFALGLFMHRGSGAADSVVAWMLMAAGVCAVVVGAVGIGWRSRRPPDPLTDD
ncbi:MAG: hypothetical protein ABIN96_10765 [Rubrivivax sp.]